MPAHRVRDTSELLWCTTPDFFIVPDIATELTGSKSGGLRHLVCHSATCVWDQSSWYRWAATASTACAVQLGAVADWWCSRPMANTLACMCSCQRRPLRTYFVTINSFSLQLMNSMFHTMLDAAGDVLRVHYISMKRDVSISQGNECTIFRWGGHYFHTRVIISSCLQQCKNYTNWDFPVMMTNVLPRFYGSQCTWTVAVVLPQTTIFTPQ